MLPETQSAPIRSTPVQILPYPQPLSLKLLVLVPLAQPTPPQPSPTAPTPVLNGLSSSCFGDKVIAAIISRHVDLGHEKTIPQVCSSPTSKTGLLHKQLKQALVDCMDVEICVLMLPLPVSPSLIRSISLVLLLIGFTDRRRLLVALAHTTHHLLLRLMP